MSCRRQASGTRRCGDVGSLGGAAYYGRREIDMAGLAPRKVRRTATLTRSWSRRGVPSRVFVLRSCKATV